MISSIVKPAVTRAITPVASFALRIGITPDAVTWAGAIGVIVCSLSLYPRGDLFLGSALIALFALSDLFDGAMARISKTGATLWGGFLDSTIDRITDSSIIIGVAIYLIRINDRLSGVVVITLLTGVLVPYIRAKAESFSITCSGGIAERTERLVIALSAIALDGLGIPYALTLGMWSLALLGVVTIFQRMAIIKKALK